MTYLSWLVLVSAVALEGWCELPRPMNLTITSSRFIHILKWEEQPSAPEGVCYMVEVHRLSLAKWSKVPGCECVQVPRICNLTDAFSNPWETYFINVTTILGNWSSTPEQLDAFKPIDRTDMDPPKVSLSVCGKSLCVNLSSPNAFLHSYYVQFTYRMTMYKSEDEFKFPKISSGLKGEEFRDLEAGRMYCVTVRIEERKDLAPSQPVCASTASVYNYADILISAVILVLLLLVLGGIFILVYCGVFGLKSPYPHVLGSIKSYNVALLPTDYDRTSCSWAWITDTSVPKERGESDNSEKDGEWILKDKGASGGYERRPQQTVGFLPGQDDFSLSSLTPQPVTATNGDSNSSDLTGKQSSVEFYSNSQPDLLSAEGDDLVSESQNCVSLVSDLTSQFLQDPSEREQKSTLMLHFGLRSPQLKHEVMEEEVAEMCPNLFSVTLGKREQEEESGGKDNEGCLEQRCDPSLPFLTERPESWAMDRATANTCMLETEYQEDEDTVSSGYMRR